MRADAHLFAACTWRALSAARLALLLVLVVPAPACGGSSTFDSDVCSAQDLRARTAASTRPAHLWSKRFGDQRSHYVESVAVDPSGSALVTGWIDRSSHTSGPSGLTTKSDHDWLVLKVSPSGDIVFRKSLGEGDEDVQRGERI